MMGSHKSEKCFKVNPELKRGRGDKRDRGERSKSRSQFRGRPRYGDIRKNDRFKRVVDKNSPGRYRDEDRDRERDREDRDRERDSEDRGIHNRLPTPRSDIELTRRVKPRYDFLDDESGSFEDQSGQ